MSRHNIMIRKKLLTGQMYNLMASELVVQRGDAKYSAAFISHWETHAVLYVQ